MTGLRCRPGFTPAALSVASLAARWVPALGLPTALLIGGRSGLAILGLVALMHGCGVFVHHGGTRLSAVGVYSLAFGIFVGLPGLWWSTQSTQRSSLFGVLAIVTASQLLTYLVFWRASGHWQGVRPGTDPTHPPAPRHIIGGLLALAAGTFLSLLASDLSAVASALQFTGALAAMRALLLRAVPKGRRWRSHLSALAVAALYALLAFDGGGRLVLASLLIALAAFMSWDGARLTLKLAALATVIPALIIFGAMRRDMVAEAGYTASAGGLGSVVGPIDTFAELVEHDRDGRSRERPYGETFAVAALAQVPRTLWSEKPVGFGAKLTEELRPQLVPSGHSMAALHAGEWYYNFGWIGLILMVPAVGLSVGYLDRAVARRLTERPGTFAGALVAPLVVSGMADLLWGGPFAFSARTVTRLMVVATAVLVVNVVASSRRRQRALAYQSP